MLLNDSYKLSALIFLVVMIYSCTASHRGLFSKRTLHEQYEDKLNNAGLKETALGSQWFAAAAKGLTQQLVITLPYKESGYFAADKPYAAGYRFTVRKGELLKINIMLKPAAGFALFTDLWQQEDVQQTTPKFIAAADSTNSISYEIEKDGNYILRLQPELLKSGNYTLTVTTGPSLAFPVPSENNPRIGSFWGAARDAGARKHEGVDIFSKFRTPVVAAADGYVNAVNENRLGGKVVWLRPNDKNYTLYYAHLDSQIAVAGNTVRVGDVLGLMGNTGNAKYTPTHLHFGIYTNNGAVDPLPFIQFNKAVAADVPDVSEQKINNLLRNNKAITLYGAAGTNATKLATLPADELLYVQSATSNFYKVILHDITEGFINTTSSLSYADNSLKKYTLPDTKNLYEKPDTSAAVKLTLNANKTVDVLAVHNNFYYVTDASNKGWLLFKK